MECANRITIYADKQQIDDLRLKRDELNAKVLEKYGTVPDWWKEDDEHKAKCCASPSESK